MMLKLKDMNCNTNTASLPLSGGEPHYSHHHPDTRCCLCGPGEPAHLTVQFDVLGEGGVDLCERAT